MREQMDGTKVTYVGQYTDFQRTVRTMDAGGRGFTVIELVVTLAVLGVLITFAIPSFDRLRDRMRLVGATQPVQEMLLYAHSETIKRFSPMVTSFAVNSTDPPDWGFGVTDGIRKDNAESNIEQRTSCVPSQNDPTQANACTIDFDTLASTTGDRTPLLRVLSADHPGVVMQGLEGDDDIVCSGGGANVRFDVPSGTSLGIDEDCAIVLRTTRYGYETRVRVSPTGRVWICSPSGSSNVSWYEDEGC